MFKTLSDRLSQTIKRISGKGRLTEETIKDALREVRIALLEADVALPVVQDFIGQVRERSLGAEVLKSLTPDQALVKIVHDELVKVMGAANESLDLDAATPVVVLVAGLQGAGKTTTVAKLARLLKERQGKKVMVVSCDVYRPAAIDQLQTLAGQVGVAFQPSSSGTKPVSIATEAVSAARAAAMDVLLVDTAGRLHIDAEMMDEIKSIHKAIVPHETLFVVDSMTGQDAANTAKAFNEALPLTGVVLTKTDGDARGGAALSVRHITGKPVKFIGAGEKTDALEPFHPDRIASRILGMGDVLSLVEEVERKVDQDEARKLTRTNAEPGWPGQHDGQNAGHGCNTRRSEEQGGRWQNQADGRDHQFNDKAGKAFSGHHPRLAQTPHCQGVRHPNSGCEPAVQTVQPDAEDDEEGVQRGHEQNDAQDASIHSRGGIFSKPAWRQRAPQAVHWCCLRCHPAVNWAGIQR
jgi:signal recognition particle GTPase